MKGIYLRGLYTFVLYQHSISFSVRYLSVLLKQFIFVLQLLEKRTCRDSSRPFSLRGGSNVYHVPTTVLNDNKIKHSAHPKLTMFCVLLEPMQMARNQK